MICWPKREYFRIVGRGQPVVFDVSVNKIKGEITGACESDFLIMLYSFKK